MEKPVKSTAELESMIHERLYRLDEVREDMEANPRLEPKVTALRWHERDEKGRNWDLASVSSAAAPYKFWIGEIVEYLRWKFDIDKTEHRAALLRGADIVSRPAPATVHAMNRPAK